MPRRSLYLCLISSPKQGVLVQVTSWQGPLALAAQQADPGAPGPALHAAGHCGILTISTCLCMLQVTTRNGGPGWLPDNLNQGRLDLYYVVLVIMSVLNVFFFIYVAKAYQYKKVSIAFTFKHLHKPMQERALCVLVTILLSTLCWRLFLNTISPMSHVEGIDNGEASVLRRLLS